MTSRSTWPDGRSARAAANDCRTIYPAHWTPPLLRAIGADACPAPRRMAPVFPLLARAFLLGVALLGIVQSTVASAAPEGHFEYPAFPACPFAKEAKAP